MKLLKAIQSKVSFKIIFFLLLFPFSVLAQTFTAVEKSPLDNRQYLSTTLENGLKVVVVSDKDTNSAGATLVVGTGSFDNPKEFKGLAHFLEHMLFLGTKKFPVPDEFQKFIQEHGGTHNATTEDEQTSYYFTIEADALPKALDRFSDFFVAPLFTKELVGREINAVDSEFQMNLQQDAWAALEVFRETCNPHHPFSQFSVGNLQTLAKDQDKLYEALIAFHQKEYRANKMTLALVGPQSVSELMQLAKKYFSTIPGNGNATPARPLVYDTPQLGLDIFMKTHGDRAELNLIFPFASDSSFEQQKAANLLAHLLGFDGKGGLSIVLKEKQWVNSVSSQYESLTREQATLTLSISLTPLGLKHIDDITQMTFSYINMLKQKGIPTYLFDEIKQLSQWDFQYVDKQDPGGLSQVLAAGLQRYPAAKLVKSFFVMSQGDYPEKEIQYLLTKLSPENMRRLVMSPGQKGNQTSQWYQASYRVEKLSEKKLSQFATAVPLSEFILPAKNPYIPQKLVIQKGGRKAKKAPQKIKMRAITLWHHQDAEFKKPKADIVINLAHPATMATPENALYTKLYTALAVDKLNEQFYSAIVAGASINLSEHARGITLSLHGYTDKQEILLKEVLTTLRKFEMQPQKFDIMKDRMQRGFSNYQHLALFKRAMTDLNILLAYPSWHPEELLVSSNKIKQMDVANWMNDFWKKCQIEVLVHGNYNSKQAKQLGNIIEKEFPYAKIAEPKNVTKVVNLGQKTLHYRPVKTTDNNHVALWYMQNPNNDLSTMAKMMLLGNILEVPFFQSLRVEKQLAYALGANSHSMNKVSGLMFWIQSTKATPSELLAEMKGFLQVHQQSMKNLTEKDLEPHRQALINELRELPQTMSERTQLWWKTIQKGDLDFDHAEKLAQELEAVKVKDLVSFSQTWLSPNSHAGQLFVVSTPDGKLKEEKSISSTHAFKEVMAYFTPQAA